MLMFEINTHIKLVELNAPIVVLLGSQTGCRVVYQTGRCAGASKWHLANRKPHSGLLQIAVHLADYLQTDILLVVYLKTNEIYWYLISSLSNIDLYFLVLALVAASFYYGTVIWLSLKSLHSCTYLTFYQLIPKFDS